MRPAVPYPSGLGRGRQEEMFRVAIEIGLESLKRRPRHKNYWQRIVGRVMACFGLWSVPRIPATIVFLLALSSVLVTLAHIRSPRSRTRTDVTRYRAEFQLQRRAVKKSPVYQTYVDILQGPNKRTPFSCTVHRPHTYRPDRRSQ